MFQRKYLVDAEALEALSSEGLEPALLKGLKGLEGQRFFSRKALYEQLEKLNADARAMKRVAKQTHTGWLGLEVLIHNRHTREWVEALVFALVVAFFIIRPFIVAPFEIPSSSMVPTIAVGDRIFATMYSYGLYNPVGEEKFFPQPVQRGDIIIFPYPRDPSVDYIKRVVGLPGETVAFQGRTVFINGQPLKEDYAYYQEEVLQEYSRRGMEPPNASFGPVTVPQGHLFVMGDNRYNSADSRVWGYVPIPTIKGRAQITYWSHDPEAGLFGGYRLGRIGNLVR